jgi:hypothetical protein
MNVRPRREGATILDCIVADDFSDRPRIQIASNRPRSA